MKHIFSPQASYIPLDQAVYDAYMFPISHSIFSVGMTYIAIYVLLIWDIGKIY
jgi:hypothetical protein